MVPFDHLMNPLPPGYTRSPSYEFSDPPYPPSQYDPFGLRQSSQPHGPGSYGPLTQSSARGNGSSVVHGDMNIRSVTYSNSGNDENIPPDNYSGATRARKRPRPDDSTDTISSFGHQEEPPTIEAPTGEVPADLVAILARQHNLNDANKTMLFSFHRVRTVCFIC
jgi:hypothetical protein